MSAGRANTLVICLSGLVAVLACAWAVLTSSTLFQGDPQRRNPDATLDASSLYVLQPAWAFNKHLDDIAMHNQLSTARSQLASRITANDTSAALLRDPLPLAVSLKQAQQLLLDRHLLSKDLQEGGFAAARVTARRSAALKDSSSSPVSGAAAVQADDAGQQHHSAEPGHQRNRSRGILIVGGSRTHLGNAYILLRVLREQLHCELPIEVVFYGTKELDPVAATLVRSFAAQQAAHGAAPISLLDGLQIHQQHLAPLLPHPEVPLTSWVAKVHALCWVTTFSQVLLLDSDNLPTQDPSVLFEDAAFTTHGFITWPDFWHDLWMQPGLYRLLNLSTPWEEDPDSLAAESGQLLMDRARHADVLEWLWLLNAHSDVVYRCLIGDKDTYRMAFQLADKVDDYFQVRHPPRQLLLDRGSRRLQGRFVHLGMGQHSPDGSALLFMHRTARGKFFPWCAASWELQQGPLGCQPTWLTMPVVQQQLLASVSDPGSMRYDAERIDMEWYMTACAYEGAHGLNHSTEAKEGAANTTRHQLELCREVDDCLSNGQVQVWHAQLPVCEYSTDQLPIPVVPVEAVPGLTGLMMAVNSVFAEAAAALHVSWVDRYRVFFGIL